MTIKFLKLKEHKPAYTSWFFYGLTRSGKTTAAATFPHPLFIQPKGEGSIDSLSGHSTAQAVTVHTGLEMLELLDHLTAKADEARPFFAKDNPKGDEIFPWQTVVVESLTHYVDILEEGLTNGQKVHMDRQKWGKVSQHLKRVHSQLSNLPVHVIYISLCKEVHNEQGKLVKAEPYLSGSSSVKLPSSCGALVYFERIEGNPRDKFVAHLGSKGVYTAGARVKALEGLPRKLEPFQWSEIAKKLGY